MRIRLCVMTLLLLPASALADGETRTGMVLRMDGGIATPPGVLGITMGIDVVRALSVEYSFGMGFPEHVEETASELLQHGVLLRLRAGGRSWFLTGGAGYAQSLLDGRCSGGTCRDGRTRFVTFELGVEYRGAHGLTALLAMGAAPYEGRMEVEGDVQGGVAGVVPVLHVGFGYVF